MKLIDVEYTFDRSKVLFYFVSENRIDFRDLVKDLAATFKTRIELRQVGIRDHARLVGGLGICGREFCCSSCMGAFQPVSIKMAKEQGLSLNPTKISGNCGKLLCCLKYEQEAYESAMKIVPSVGSVVKTEQGEGIVVDNNLLRETVSVKFEQENETDINVLPVSEVTVMSGDEAKEFHRKKQQEAEEREQKRQARLAAEAERRKAAEQNAAARRKEEDKQEIDDVVQQTENADETE
jgi:cell fate regulator YaaT (PSP1 superfamily)